MGARSTTRAVLTGLSGGASLEAALRAGAEVATSSYQRVQLLRAAEDAKSEPFRAEALARVPFEPPIVGLLLGRAPAPALRDVARVALIASRKTGGPRVAVVPPLYLSWLAWGVLAGALAAKLAVAEPGFGPWRSAGPMSWAVVATSAALMLLFASHFVLSSGTMPMRALGMIWPLESRRWIDADTASLLRWLVAGEHAGLVPGLVLGALAGSGTLLERLRVERLQRTLRGASSVSNAVALWAQRGDMDRPLLALVGAVPEGETPLASVERMARVAALSARRRRGEGLVLLIAGALIAASAFLVARTVIAAVIAMGAVIS